MVNGYLRKQNLLSFLQNSHKMINEASYQMLFWIYGNTYQTMHFRILYTNE